MALQPASHQPASRHLANLLPLTPASAGDFAAFDKVGSVIIVKRGETLFYEGDAADCYFKVASGAVRSCKLLADGRRHIGAFFLAGDFIGINDEESHLFTAEAVSDTTLIRYSRRSFDNLLSEQPALGRCLLRMLCHGLTAAHEQMLLLGRKTAQEKLASFLLIMAERSGGGDAVVLPMTRADIGDYLGLTIETVSRAVSHLKSEGIIQLKSANEVVIRNRALLEAMAEGV